MPSARTRWRISLATAALGLALSACGSEREFEAQEFVDEANSRGATLELGEPLYSGSEGSEVHELDVVGPVEGTSDVAAEQHSGAGSLTVHTDAAAASDEYERCEAAATIVCYRAANVSLAIEELTPEQRSALDAALSAMGSG